MTTRGSRHYQDHDERCRWFASARGWAVAPRRFTLLDLALRGMLGEPARDEIWSIVGIDHTSCFVCDGRPVASLSQPYVDRRGGPDYVGPLSRAFAECGVPLVVSEPPERSWWYPGWTVSVLFEPAPWRPEVAYWREVIKLNARITRAFRIAGVHFE